MSSRDINDLHPDLQGICKQFLLLCESAGLHVFIVCTYRSGAEQDALYEMGRTTKSIVGVSALRPLGGTVTNARAGQSAHNFTIDDKPAARAFDIGVLVNGKYDGGGSSPDWQKAGEIGQQLGLDWYGAPGAKFFELAHFQLRG